MKGYILVEGKGEIGAVDNLVARLWSEAGFWQPWAKAVRWSNLHQRTNATVGGVEKQDENVIIGNGQQGVSILPGSQGNQVLGNQIGVIGPRVLDGFYFTVPNGAEGVLIADSSSVRTWLARPANTRPAGVTSTVRVVRLSSVTCRARSRSRTV